MDFAIWHSYFFLTGQQILRSWVSLLNHCSENSSDMRLFNWSNFGKSCYIFKICLGLLIKEVPSYFVLSESWLYSVMLIRFIYGNYWISCIAEFTHNSKKSGYGCAEMEGSKDPGRLCGLPGLSGCQPWFLVAKSNFHSLHVGWETAGVHTSSQNFGFLICETWPNVLISVAGRRSGEYRMGMNKLQSSQTHCHDSARSGSETDPGLRNKNGNKMGLGRSSQFLKW